MNDNRVITLRAFAERMIAKSNTDHTSTDEEENCPGCQKMRNGLRLLQLAIAPEVEQEVEEIDKEVYMQATNFFQDSESFRLEEARYYLDAQSKYSH